MDFYDEYYETDMLRPNAVGCYCKLMYVCSECKENYN